MARVFKVQNEAYAQHIILFLHIIAFMGTKRSMQHILTFLQLQLHLALLWPYMLLVAIPIDYVALDVFLRFACGLD